MLDEAPLILLFFRLCKLAISGSFVILISQVAAAAPNSSSPTFLSPV